MLVGMLGCAIYRLRDRLPFVQSMLNRAGIKAGASMPRNSSNWREVEGDEEALFVAEHIDDGFHLQGLRR